jgi:predicted esterase
MAPFDAIISFSQGAMLAAVYLSNQIIEHHYHYSSSSHNDVAKVGITPLKCIFIGAGVPSCYRNLFESIHAIQRNHDQNAGHFKTLHVVGRRDVVNPTYMGEQLASIFNGQLHLHDDGHVIPLDSCSLQVIRKFIIDE